MKMIKVLSVLMLSVLLCAGAPFPVFIGDTANYLTNQPGFTSLVVSNRHLVTVNKTNGFVGVETNSPKAQLHVGNGGGANIDGTLALGTTSGSQTLLSEMTASFTKGFGTYVSMDEADTILSFLPRVGIAANSAIAFAPNDNALGAGRSYIRDGGAGTNALADATGVRGTGTLLSSNLVMARSGRLVMPSGTDTRAGNATLVAGTVTVANTTVTASTVVMLTRKTSGGTLGTAITYTLSAGASFTVNSDSALDTSTFSYLLIENP